MATAVPEAPCGFRKAVQHKQRLVTQAVRAGSQPRGEHEQDEPGSHGTVQAKARQPNDQRVQRVTDEHGQDERNKHIAGQAEQRDQPQNGQQLERGALDIDGHPDHEGFGPPGLYGRLSGFIVNRAGH